MTLVVPLLFEIIILFAVCNARAESWTEQPLYGVDRLRDVSENFSVTGNPGDFIENENPRSCSQYCKVFFEKFYFRLVARRRDQVAVLIYGQGCRDLRQEETTGCSTRSPNPRNPKKSV